MFMDAIFSVDSDDLGRLKLQLHQFSKLYVPYAWVTRISHAYLENKQKRFVRLSGMLLPHCCIPSLEMIKIYPENGTSHDEGCPSRPSRFHLPQRKVMDDASIPE